jgi:hypothetical protein
MPTVRVHGIVSALTPNALPMACGPAERFAMASSDHHALQFARSSRDAAPAEDPVPNVEVLGRHLIEVELTQPVTVSMPTYRLC